jgi:hypothetical protein
VSLSDLLCEVVQLSCHLIALWALLLCRLLLFLVPVISNSWKMRKKGNQRSLMAGTVLPELGVSLSQHCLVIPPGT